jgi:hypothetical protein
MVSGERRVTFDPAGTWHHPTAPERGDVIYGATPPILGLHLDDHARAAYRVELQTLPVAPETAARALALVEPHGSAAKATCALAVSGVLRELGFDEVGRGWFPDRLMRDFAAVPGVAHSTVIDDTEDGYAPGGAAPVPAGG